MRLTGLLRVRNENWILGFSLRAMMEWLDEIVILDHCSTDESRAIEQAVSREFPGRLHIIEEDDPTWREMDGMQLLLDTARRYGGTHFAIVDADEVLTANLLPTIRAEFERIPQRTILQLPWVCLARGVDRFYSSGAWHDNWVSVGFGDDPAWHWKPQGSVRYDFHHRNPMGYTLMPYRPIKQHLANHGGGLLHFQFVDERRLRAKQANYLCTEVLRWPGRLSVPELNAMYGRAIYESDPYKVYTAPVNSEWMAPYSDLMNRFYRPELPPWQEAAVASAIEVHGRARFAGLDLFGVA